MIEIKPEHAMMIACFTAGMGFQSLIDIFHERRRMKAMKKYMATLAQIRAARPHDDDIT